MNCEQVKELLSEYLDDVLAPEERQRVAAHLQTCAACSAMMDDFRRFDALLVNLPRVSPDAALREKIFSSPEYLELTGTFDGARRSLDRTRPYKRVGQDDEGRPHLVALPGGRYSSSSPHPADRSPSHLATRSIPTRRRGRGWGQRAMYIMIAATVLLTIGVGSLIGWNMWQRQEQTAQQANGITPPAGPQTGPIPAGIRFVFLRDGALWSAPTDGGTGIVRMTAENVTVATSWAVRPALPGRPAGNMLAYIDLQQGYVHTIRSDGQSDTTIRQPLVKAGVTPSSVWDTATGSAILNSLSWSKDGSMLAFVADPRGTGQPGLYIYSLATDQVHEAPLPLKGAVAEPVWSPDGARIAFKLAHDGKNGILDYNTQNNGVLIIADGVNTQANPNDTVLALDWAPDATMPAITWSVGTVGHVHSIWLQHVGAGSATGAQRLLSGDYVEAMYSRVGNSGRGSWLVVATRAGLPGDMLNVELSSAIKQLTSGKQVSDAQWSPNGTQIAYFDGFTSDLGALHLINTGTGSDNLVAANVAANPAPAWSPDGQRLAYSTGTHVLIVDVQASKISQPLKLQGPASALSWSTTAPNQLILAMSDGQQGIYLVDTQHDTSLQLDKNTISGPILWTQIP